MSGLRNVLLVTYYFPPSGGPGVQRMLKFTKYLPEFGWRPLVLTVREDAEYPVLDPSLWRDVPPEAHIVRTRITEFYNLYRGVAREKGPLDVRLRNDREGILRRVMRAVRANVFVPDGRIGWLPHALGPGERLIREEGAAAVVSSGPPFTSHLIGGLLHERTGIPWIADFRDPWTRAPFYPDRPAPVRRIDERLEAWTVRTAARTVAVNRGILDDLAARYAPADRSRLVTIPNGFDEADFAAIPRTTRERLTIVHSGSLFASRDPAPLREAMAALCETEPGFADGVEVILAGRNDAAAEAAFTRPPLDRIVRTPGYLPHDESLALLRSAHLLLLLIGVERMNTGMLTGKVFEYLGSGTPILAIAPEGEASDLLRRCRAGFVLDPLDREGAQTLLRDLWLRFRNGQRRFADPDPKEIAAYSRRSLTGRLAATLDAVAVEVAGRTHP